MLLLGSSWTAPLPLRSPTVPALRSDALRVGVVHGNGGSFVLGNGGSMVLGGDVIDRRLGGDIVSMEPGRGDGGTRSATCCTSIAALQCSVAIIRSSCEGWLGRWGRKTATPAHPSPA